MIAHSFRPFTTAFGLRLLVPVLLAAGQPASGALFNTCPTYPAGRYPERVGVADLNGDGWPDIITGNFVNPCTVTVLLGQSDGRWSSPVSYPAVRNLNLLYGMVVADFDNDSVADVAVAVKGFSGGTCEVNLLRGNDDGTLGAPEGQTLTSFTALCLVAGDFNEDGWLDAIVGGQGGSVGDASMLPGQPGGGFGAPIAVPISESCYAAAVADLNGDGHLDLIGVSATRWIVTTLFGLGDGRFQAASEVHYDTVPEPWSVTAGDVNGDGKPDVVVGNENYQEVSVFLNAGDGGLNPPTRYKVGPYPRDVVIEDFTGDGVADIATANFGWDIDGDDGTTVSILVGLGEGAFAQTALEYVVGEGPRSLAVGDLNRDGQQDLIACNRIGGDVAVLLHQPTDAPLDKWIGPLAAPSVHESRRSAYKLAAADFDGDALPDIGMIVGGAVGFLANGEDLTTTAYSRIASLPNGVSSSCFVGTEDFNGDGRDDFAAAGAGKLQVFLGEGVDGFSAPTIYQCPEGRATGATADLDLDGRLDLLVGGTTEALVQTYLGLGGGSFAVGPSVSVPKGDFDLAVGDMNRDGIPDLVTAHFSSRWDYEKGNLFLGNGDGTFQTPRVLDLGPAPHSPVLGDLNSDGALDLIVANPGLDETGRSIRVLFGRGDGTLGGTTTYQVGAVPVLVALADLDGNGHLDVVVANRGTTRHPDRTLSVLLGNGTGCLTEARSVLLSDQSWSLATGDFNYDGRPDVAAGCEAGVTLLLNTVSTVPGGLRLQVSECGGAITLSWLAAGERLVLETTVQLLEPQNWQPAPGQMERRGRFWFFWPQPGSPIRFYRLRRL